MLKTVTDEEFSRKWAAERKISPHVTKWDNDSYERWWGPNDIPKCIRPYLQVSYFCSEGEMYARLGRSIRLILEELSTTTNYV